ncbi:MAG TPA: SpoIIE family protein phosphatase [Spirochaetota bacterium]|nr:SpoIIE family protein phosphatase [Spirochaetota bacterium]HPI88166.1 SpoIIE family protein phosphatase [Spirochaetota bacterium]HPR47941.1 SpoIIE family protein phosphatase [Spirochaetota bacterium]
MIIFVLIKDWKSQVNRYYSFMAIGAFGILFTMFISYAFPDSIDLTRTNRITQLSTAVFFTMVFPMSLIFPKREKDLPFYLTLLIVLPGFAIGALAGFTDLTISAAYFREGLIVRDFKFFYRVYAAVVILYLLAGTINFIIKYLREKVEIYKLQMRYLFVGGSLAVIFAAVCSIILPLFFGYSRFYVIGPSIASFFFTFSMFYSVIAYNLMDIRTAIHKTTMYIIISMAIILPIFGIIHVSGNRLGAFKDFPFFISAVIIVITFILYSYYIQPIIDKAFRRKQYAFENIVDDFIRNIEDVKELQRVVEQTVDLLRDGLFLKHAFFIMINDETRKYEMLYYKGENEFFELQPVERSSSLIRWFVRNQDYLYLNRLYTDDKSFGDIKIRDEILSFYTQYNIQLVLPVYHERRVLGLLCLGEKETLAGFQPNELEKLSYFQSKSNDFISTALTYKKAMKEQFVARTLDMSNTILANSIPSALPNLKSITFGAFIIPKYEEGTDYFDFIRPGNQGVGLIATDISGVGVASSLYSVILRSAFQSCLNEAPSTYSVMQKLNKVVFEYTRGKGGLITGYYLYYDIKTMKLMYTNAGFPALEVFRVEKNNFDTLDTEGIPLGYDVTTSYGIGRTNMLKGDIGILYSKTLISSKNQKSEEYSLLRLRGIVSGNRIRHPSEIADLIKKDYETFMGISSPNSDVIVIVFKIM